MSKGSALTLFAAIYFAGLLLVTAPASLLAAVALHISTGKLLLANCQGTLWHGSATPLLVTGKDSSLALHTLHWRLRLQTLLKGRLGAELYWDNLASNAAMRLTADRHGITLDNLLLPLPAEALGELSPYLKPAQFSGNLLVESQQLSFTNHRLQGSAKAYWNHAGSALSAINPLGNYQVDIKAGTDGLSAVLSTRDGTLLLDGQGNLSPDDKFHFSGTARAAPESAAMLSELLHHLGPELSPGVYRIFL